MDGQAQLQSQICQQLMGGLESDRYLRLQFALKKIWGEPSNVYAQAPLLDKKQQVNKWMMQPVNEQMDDASPENIKQLIKITEQYIDKGYTFETRYKHGLQVKEGIERFIKEESQEVFARKLDSNSNFAPNQTKIKVECH